MISLYSIIFAVINILLCHFLKNNILDLVLRFIQNVNKPLDLLINYLEGSQTSLIPLSFKKQLYNFIVLIIAIIMLLSEFATLSAVIDASVTDQPLPFLGINIKLSIFAALGYITIATLLGFFALELIGYKKLFNGILFEENIENSEIKDINQNKKIMVSILFFIILILLATLQGYLAKLRYDLSDISDNSTILIRYRAIIIAFYFVLGFLTPIIAAMALLSLDIFTAILANFLSIIIQFIQKVIAAIYFAFEAVIQLVSSPFIKILELFGIYQIENINIINKNRVKEAIKTAPLNNNNELYFENLLNIHNKFKALNKLTVFSKFPTFSISLPSSEFSINDKSSFKDLINYLVNKYYYLSKGKIIFQYIDRNENLKEIDNNDKILNYFNITRSILLKVE
jgi:hypothetical protein